MSVLALDLGGSHVGCAVVNGGTVLASSSVSTDARSLRELLPRLAVRLRESCRAAGISPEACEGMGIGFPAIVDSRSGELLSTLGDKFADLTAEDLQSWSNSEFGLRIRIENDAKLALLGERFSGAARGFEDVVMVTLGTGIGVAVMLQNRLLRSHLGQAGNLGGHLVVRFDGRPCVCGAIGCAEAEASTSVLPTLCREWPGFAESSLAQESQLNFATLFQSRDGGDRVAGELIDHCLDIWSALAVSLVHAYGPQLLLFGGGIAGRGEEILSPIRAYVGQHSWKTSRGAARIEAGVLGADAALVGAEALFLEEFV
jgi:glucokinase